MILATLTIGTSYSYYSISDEQTNPNNVATGCFKTTFTDGNVINLTGTGSGVTYPMSEATAMSKITPYHFTVSNTCTSSNSSKDIKFIATINTLTTSGETSSTALTNLLRVKVNQTSPSTVTGASAMLSSKIYTGLNPNVKTSENVQNSYKIAEGTIPAGTSKTFNVYLWIDESATDTIYGANFIGKVLVYTYQ